MVLNGFSFLEVRKMYIDELYDYYDHVFYNLDKQGKLKEGAYDKMNSIKNGNEVEHTIKTMRKQMFKSIANKK